MGQRAPDWPYKIAGPPPDERTVRTPVEAGDAIERLRPRALRRMLGQFWTPEPIAEAMIRWALCGRPGRFLDPGAGPLTFLRAAERVFGAGRSSCVAFELDAGLVAAARSACAPGTCDVRAEDFLRTTTRLPGLPVVCNPPYTRHHGIRDDVKRHLAAWAERTFGFRPSGFLGAYGWFLLKALDVTGGRSRLCFITPVELLTSRSGLALFQGLPARFWPRRVVVFGPAFDAFPGVDATAAVSFIDPSPAAHAPAMLVLRSWPAAERLDEWLAAESPRAPGPWADQLPLVRGRRPATVAAPEGPSRHRAPLLAYARVTRGVATGANAFFLYDGPGRAASGIERAHFVRVAARARDVVRLRLTIADLDALDRRGRPTHLLALRRGTTPAGPLAGRLAEGERLGLPTRPLLSRRRPWWLTEVRDAPAILFTYLSRGNPRFVLNEARAVGLTTFLAVRPGPPPHGLDARAWAVCLCAALNAPGTLASFDAHARSYGGRTRKIEPRELERIELPALGRLPAATLRASAKRARTWLGYRDRVLRRRAAAEWERELLGRLRSIGDRAVRTRRCSSRAAGTRRRTCRRSRCSPRYPCRRSGAAAPTRRRGGRSRCRPPRTSCPW